MKNESSKEIVEHTFPAQSEDLNRLFGPAGPRSIRVKLYSDHRIVSSAKGSYSMSTRCVQTRLAGLENLVETKGFEPLTFRFASGYSVL